MFKLPENLTGLSLEELSTLLDQATTEFQAFAADSEDISEETLGRMAELADSIEALRDAVTALAAETVVASEEVVEASVEASVEVEETSAEDRKAALAARVPAVVAAAKKPVATVKMAVQKPIPSTKIPESTTPKVIIAAAVDVPQFYVGQQLDPKGLADAIHNKARMLSDSRGNQTVYPVATIERPFGKGYDLEGLDQAEMWDALTAGTTTNALTAAGGWCAPSQIVYDLFEVECENDLLFMLPTFRVTRGGIRWPVFEPFDSTFAPAFVWTEADDIAASGTKPCIVITCPTFTECRLDAVGLCITAGNLMDRAYPEQIRWFINRAMRAYARENALRKLNIVIDDSIPVAAPASFGAASAVIASLLLQAADYRETNGLCCGQLLDVVFPCWASDLVKADVARQEGTLSIGSLPSDADVRRWFAAANLNVSFINHWQTITGDPATTWPATVQYLLGYPGSWVEFNGGRLDLGVIRDSVLNATNDFTAVWMEEFYCVGRRGPQSRIVTVPVCASGETGGPVDGPGVITCPAG